MEYGNALAGSLEFTIVYVAMDRKALLAWCSHFKERFRGAERVSKRTKKATNIDRSKTGNCFPIKEKNYEGVYATHRPYSMQASSRVQKGSYTKKRPSTWV